MPVMRKRGSEVAAFEGDAASQIAGVVVVGIECECALVGGLPFRSARLRQ
jgi:hypothetical protein